MECEGRKEVVERKGGPGGRGPPPSVEGKFSGGRAGRVPGPGLSQGSLPGGASPWSPVR